MAEQDNSPIDPFEDLYVRTEDTNPLQTPLPPEMMAMTLEEALLRGCQRCVFTRFMPGMHLCTADTVSTIANASNSINWNIGARWTFDTYVKAAEPGRRGKYYRNHEHQCIMANVIDDLYLGYTGGDPDAPVHRMDASTGAAESQERVDRTATRIALAAYQRAATPRVVRRVAMVYGSEYEGVYRKKLMGDFDKEFNRETIRDGRPTAVDLAALRQLPFTPEAVPLQYQPSASPRHPRHVYDHISILVVNVPQRHLDEDIMPLTDSMLRFRADPQETETPSLSVQSSEYVQGDYLRRMAARMEGAGLALDLLCLAEARPPVLTLTPEEFHTQQGIEDFENDPTLLGSGSAMLVNAIPILEGVIRPGGRIVTVESETTFGALLPEPRSCTIDEMSLVM